MPNESANNTAKCLWLLMPVPSTVQPLSSPLLCKARILFVSLSSESQTCFCMPISDKFLNNNYTINHLHIYIDEKLMGHEEKSCREMAQ